jgi:trk system potassium uptake protein TrkA
MTMRVLIIGGGQEGTYLASLLLGSGHWVRLIEIRPEVADRLRKELPPEVVVTGSGTDPNVLESAGIHRADVVAAVTRADENNLVVASLARFRFHVPRVVARVNNPKNAWMFTADMGVDVALNRADMMGHLIAEEMSLGDMVTLVKLRKGQYSLIEEKVAPEAVAAGKALRDLDLPKACILAVVLRKGELIIPDGDTVLQPADEIIALVHASSLDSLAGMLGHPA